MVEREGKPPRGALVGCEDQGVSEDLGIVPRAGRGDEAACEFIQKGG